MPEPSQEAREAAQDVLVECGYPDHLALPVIARALDDFARQWREEAAIFGRAIEIVYETLGAKPREIDVAMRIRELLAAEQERDALRRRVAELEAEAAEARGAQIVDQNAIRIQRERAEAAEDFILREGYRRCDVPACNCRSWHRGEARLSQEESDDV